MRRLARWSASLPRRVFRRQVSASEEMYLVSGGRRLPLRPMKASRFVILPSADAGGRDYSMVRRAWERRAEQIQLLADRLGGDREAAQVAWALGQRPAGPEEHR